MKEKVSKQIDKLEEKEMYERLQSGFISSERKEFLFHKMARLQGDPKCYSTGEICSKLGIDRQTYYIWKQDPRYLRIVDGMLKSLRDEYEAQIQAKVIQKALAGSKYHTDTYFQLQGRFVTKVEHSKKSDIPTDISEIQKEIDQLTNETSDLKVKK